MFSVQIQGVDKFAQTLQRLANQGAPRASGKAMRYTLQFLRQQVKGRAPRGKTGDLQRKVSVKVSTKAGVVEGKVSLGSRHAHLVTLGTTNRYRKSIGGRFRILRPASQDFRNKRTGKMTANPFFRVTMEANADRAVRIMEAQLKRFIQEEADKARR